MEELLPEQGQRPKRNEPPGMATGVPGAKNGPGQASELSLKPQTVLSVRETLLLSLTFLR